MTDISLASTGYTMCSFQVPMDPATPMYEFETARDLVNDTPYIEHPPAFLGQVEGR